MIVKTLGEGPPRELAVIFEAGERAVDGLLEVAESRTLGASHFTAIGAFREVTIAWFDLQRKDYLERTLQEQVEVVSLVGNITLGPEGKRRVHAHVALGRQDYSAWAGHLVEGIVRPTLEVFLTETPGQLRRRHDPETGLPLIR